MQTIFLLVIAAVVWYCFFKDINEQKKKQELERKKKEEQERRIREEKERERRELARISEIRAREPGIRKVASKTGFVGKCPSCGASIKDAAMFCMYCGTSFADHIQEQVEYVDSRTPLEKKIDMEYEEKMAKIKKDKLDSWIMAFAAIVIVAMLLGTTLLIVK